MSKYTDLIGTTSSSSTATSSQLEYFYNKLKQVADMHCGHISGAGNILALFENQFTIQEIKDFCSILSLTKEGFSYKEEPYQGETVVQNIYIENSIN